MHSEQKVIITLEEYHQLRSGYCLLNELRKRGVESWEHYQDASEAAIEEYAGCGCDAEGGGDA